MSALPTVGIQRAAEASAPRDAERKPRNLALDFTKGVLVLLMVLYHWINYFVQLEEYGYRYLRFITPSFIFITGFLISNVYMVNYATQSSSIRRRLVIRGGKLLIIFTILNLLAAPLLARRSAGWSSGMNFFWGNLVPTFITGNGRTAVFSVLVPISYLLIIAPVLLWACRRYRAAWWMSCAAAFSGILLLDQVGLFSAHLELFAIGLLGVALGRIPLGRIDSVARRLLPLGILYVAYCVALHFWREIYSLQVVGVCLSLLLVYGVGIRLAYRGWLQQHVVTLGRYSLLAYIGQIGLIMALAIVLKRSDLGLATLIVVSCLGSFLLTSGLIEGVHWARGKSKAVDDLYKTVFA